MKQFKLSEDAINRINELLLNMPFRFAAPIVDILNLELSNVGEIPTSTNTAQDLDDGTTSH